MKCSQLLFGTVSLGVVVLVYLPTSTHCEDSSEESTIHNETSKLNSTFEIKPGHTLKIGLRQPNDTLVFNGTVMKKNPDRSQKVSTKFEWPDVIDEPIYTISKIEIKDKGNGGLINVTYGGLENIFVELYLESQIGKGIEYQIKIYANSIEDHYIKSLSAKL